MKNIMKQILRMTLFVGLLSVFFALMISAANPTGSCGTDLTWSLDLSSGVFTITGSGTAFVPEDGSGNTVNVNPDMGTGYTNRDYNAYASQIKKIVFEAENVTSIARASFGRLHSCETLVLPKNFKSLAATYSIIEMNKLSRVYTYGQDEPEAGVADLSSLTSIGYMSLFLRGIALDHVIFGEDVSVNSQAFANPGNIKTLTVLDKDAAMNFAAKITGLEKICGYELSTAQTYADSNENITFEVVKPELPSGSCGTDLIWTFNPDDGVLTITGSGTAFAPEDGSGNTVNVNPDMGTGYTDRDYNAYASQIKKIVFEAENVTSIARASFGRLHSCETLVLPKNFKSLAATYSIIEMNKLSRVYTYGQDEPEAGVADLSSLTSIGYMSLYLKGSALDHVIFGEDVSVHAEAFAHSGNIKTLTVLDKDVAMNFAAKITGLEKICGYELSTAQTYADSKENITFEPIENIISSGVCGDDLTWKLTTDGVFTVKGSGTAFVPEDGSGNTVNVNPDMGTGYTNRDYNAYASQIKKIVFEAENVTSIARASFGRLHSCETLVLPKNFKSLTIYSIIEMNKLSRVYTYGQDEPEAGVADLSSLTSIGYMSLYLKGSALDHVIFGEDVSVHAEAFAHSGNIKTLTVLDKDVAMNFAAKITGLEKICGYELSTAQTYADSKENITFESIKNIISSGVCGDDLTWELTTDGVFTVKGSGTAFVPEDGSGNTVNVNPDMGTGYTDRDYNAYATQIKKIVFEAENVTSIARASFGRLHSCETLVLPKNLKSLAVYSIIEMNKLSRVYTYGQDEPKAGVADLSSLTSIGYMSLYLRGIALDHVIFGEDVSVQVEAFANPGNIKTLTVLDKDVSMNFAAKITGLETVIGYGGSTADEYSIDKDLGFVPLSADGILTFEGFQIRETGYNGLRSLFSASVSMSDRIEKAGYSIVELGTIVASSEKLAANGDEEVVVNYSNGEVSTLSYAKKFEVMSNGNLVGKILASSNEETVNFACTIINFTEDNYYKDVCFRGYVVLKDAEGNFYIYYADLKDAEGETYNVASLESVVSNLATEGSIDLNTNISYLNVVDFKSKKK